MIEGTIERVIEGMIDEMKRGGMIQKIKVVTVGKVFGKSIRAGRGGTEKMIGKSMKKVDKTMMIEMSIGEGEEAEVEAGAEEEDEGG